MIRVATVQDAAAFAAIYAPIVTDTHISFEEQAPSVDEMRARITATLAATPWLAAEIGEQIAGYAYASRHRERAGYRWSVDVSCYVDARFRGRGVGRALYEALMPILDAQGFYRAYAGITLPNDASVGLHRALGFEPIGVYRRVGWKAGKWYDVAWFGRDIGQRADDGTKPGEPLPFAQIRASQP